MHSLSKYGTLEIRGHSGSTDASKIASWIELLQGIMQCKAIKSSVDSMEVVAHLVGASETLRGYIRERVAKFSPEVSSEVDQVLDDNEESTQTLPMQVIVSPSLQGSVSAVINGGPLPGYDATGSDGMPF
jgi:hypothetical protein